MQPNTLKIVTPGFYKRLHDKYYGEMRNVCINMPEGLDGASKNFFMVVSAQVCLTYLEALFKSATSESLASDTDFTVDYESVKATVHKLFNEFYIDDDFAEELEATIGEIVGDDKISLYYAKIYSVVERFIERVTEEASKREFVENIHNLTILLSRLGFVSFDYDKLTETILGNSTRTIPERLTLDVYGINDFSCVKHIVSSDHIAECTASTQNKPVEVEQQWSNLLSGYLGSRGTWFAVIDTDEETIIASDTQSVLVNYETIRDVYRAIDIYVLDV